MHRHLKIAALAALTILGAGVALAQEDEDTPQSVAVEMRQGHMLNYATNLSTLGGMAKGETPYDAATAQAAADNIFHLASIKWDYYWLEGTAAGEYEGSAAKPEIWSDRAGFEARHQDLLTASTALQAAAGKDQAALQGAMGAVGQACGGCHQAYRVNEQ